jgi:hypothetical protein
MKIKAITCVVLFLLGAGGAGATLNVNASFAKSSASSVSAIAKSAQKGKITNPSTAAQRLYQAWQKKSRKSARKVASAEAIDKLFSTKWMPMKLKGCKNTDGSFECIYHNSKLDLDIAMIIEGGASAGYHVESVSFSSEAVFMPAPRPLRRALLSAAFKALFKGATS